MSVSKPDFLLTFNESAGTIVTNHGSVADVYVIDPASTGYTWGQNEGLYPETGYLQGTVGGNGLLALGTIAAAPSGAIESISAVAAFTLSGISDSEAVIIMPGTSPVDGDINIICVAEGEGFNVIVAFRNDGSGSTDELTFGPFDFGDDIIVAASLDATDQSAVVARAKVNDLPVQTSSPANFATFNFTTSWPRLLHRMDFPATSGAFGFQGKIRIIAYDRGTAWSSSDLEAITANPAAAIEGYPGGGPAPAAITGTGALTSSKPTLAATGARGSAGTGAITSSKPTITASVSTSTPYVPQSITGTGAITSTKPAVSATGKHGSRDVGQTVELLGVVPKVSGTGTVSPPGSSNAITGTGALTAPKVALTGSGVRGSVGAGAITSLKPTVAGEGTVTVPSAGPNAITGSGALTAPKVTLVSGGARGVVGTAVLTIASVTISGEGTVTVPAGPAHISGEGQLTAPIARIAGSGKRGSVGTGSVFSSRPRVRSGDGDSPHFAASETTVIVHSLYRPITG